MRTNNFISLLGHTLKNNIDLGWQVLIIGIAFLLANYPLYLPYSANFWYVPFTGIILFPFAFTVSDWLKTKIKSLSTDDDRDNIVTPIIITQFGKGNTAMNNLFSYNN